MFSVITPEMVSISKMYEDNDFDYPISHFEHKQSRPRDTTGTFLSNGDKIIQLRLCARICNQIYIDRWVVITHQSLTSVDA